MNWRDHSQHLKGMVIPLVIYATAIYVLFAAFDTLRYLRPKVTGWAVAFAFLGFAAGAFLMYKHYTCEPCQQRWNSAKRRFGMHLIE